MSTVSKKFKIEHFESLQRERDLLQRYFWDSREGVKPEAKARVRMKDGDVLLFAVYRTQASHGGYIVLESQLKYAAGHGKPSRRQAGTPGIRYWNDWREETGKLTNYESEYVRATREALEVLRRALAESGPDAGLDSDGYEMHQSEVL